MADENKESTVEALQVMFGPHGADGVVEKPATPPEPKPAEPPAAAAPATPAPAKAPTKPKSAPRKPAKPATEPSFTDRDRIVAEAAVTGAATAARKTGKDVTEDIPVRSDLSDEQRERLAVMDFLGRKDGKYADLADKTVDFWKKEKGYAASWEKANPGKRYNPKDDDHEEFFKANEPFQDDTELDTHLEKAGRDLDKAKLDQRVDEKVNKRLTEQEQLNQERERVKSEAEEVAGEVDNAGLKLITALVPEAAKHFTVDGKPLLTDEQWAKFAEEDPAAAKVLRKESEYLGRKMKELERLNRYPKTYPPDPNNALHASLSQTVLGAEEKILALPPKDQLHNGKQFISQQGFGEKFYQIATDKKTSEQEKRSAVNDLQKRYWMLEPGHVKQLLIDQHRKRASEKLSDAREFEDIGKKKVSKVAPNGTPNAENPPVPAAGAPPTPAPAKRVPAERPPSSPGGDIMPTGGDGGRGNGTALETLQSIGI